MLLVHYCFCFGLLLLLIVPKCSAFCSGVELGSQICPAGANSGLGYETMRVLTMRGAHVIGTGRTAEKAETACASIDGKATPVVLELTDLDSCAVTGAGSVF